VTLVTIDQATGLRYSPTHWTKTGETPTPDGCRWCGIPQYGHYLRYRASASWHQWTKPTDAQRLARMKARRAQRLAPPPEPTSPLHPDGTPDLTGASIVIEPGDCEEPDLDERIAQRREDPEFAARLRDTMNRNERALERLAE
jgi:hypothetical protein